MPRRAAQESKDPAIAVGGVGGLMGGDEAVNYGTGEDAPEAPQVPLGTVQDGVVKRVSGAKKAHDGEFTPAERAAMAASQAPPGAAVPAPEDPTEIPGLPYNVAVKDVLQGLVSNMGWEAISDSNAMSLVVAVPRFYRLLRALHARGIYGDRKDRGLMDERRVREMVG